MASISYEELTYVTTNVTARSVKNDALKKFKSVIDVKLSQENLIEPKNLNIGFQTKSMMKQCLLFFHKDVREDTDLTFQKVCIYCYKAILAKIQEGSSYNLTKYISSLNPNLFARNPEVVLEHLNLCLEQLHDNYK